MQFLHNVSINLKEGGYFIGTVPDGKRINACIKNSKLYHAPMLRIEAHWQGPPQCFGSPYICAIGDTVTSGMLHACDLQAMPAAWGVRHLSTQSGGFGTCRQHGRGHLSTETYHRSNPCPEPLAP